MICHKDVTHLFVKFVGARFISNCARGEPPDIVLRALKSLMD